MPYASNPHDGVRISYEVAGVGPPVLLLHGLSQTGRSWQRNGFVDGLGDHFTAVAIDARSHGRSDGPHDANSHGGFGAMATDVVAVLNALGIESAHVVGYSMGATTGYLLGRDHPQRLRSLSLGGGPYRLSTDQREGMIEDARLGPDALIADYERSLGKLPSDRRAEILDLDWDAQLAGIVAMSQTEGLAQEMFVAYTMPCLLYAGDCDDLALDQVREIAGWIPDAELHILSGLDHNQANVDGTLILPQIIRFLGRVEADRS